MGFSFEFQGKAFGPVDNGAPLFCIAIPCATLPSCLPPPLEQAEKLEQLRFLQTGISIHVLEVPHMGTGVDTPEDLEQVRAIIKERT